MALDINDIAKNNLISEMKEKIKIGTDINIKDEFGYTPLHKAIANKHLDMAMLLLDSGADGSIQDNEGFTPLHYTFEHYIPEMPSVINSILNRKPEALHIENKHGEQPLGKAVFNGDVPIKVIKLLLQSGADKNHNFETGSSPLDLVKEYNIKELNDIFDEY